MSDTLLSSEWYNEWNNANNEIDQELLLNYTFKITFKKNYLCPFDDKMEKCLDIGFFSGIWMMEMGSEFPHCEFHGVDPKPISPDLVYPNNCLFKQEDYLNGVSYPSHFFDVVHLRMVLSPLSVEQTLHLLDEVARVTKKGGFIEFLEPSFSPSNNIGPLLTKLFTILNEAPEGGQIHDKFDGILTERGFTNPCTSKVAIPLGKWGSMVGEFSMAALKLVTSTSDYIKSELKLDDEEALNNFLEEVEKECDEYRPQVHMFGGFAQKST